MDESLKLDHRVKPGDDAECGERLSAKQRSWDKPSHDEFNNNDLISLAAFSVRLSG
jgi:hypothetical protein